MNLLPTPRSLIRRPGSFLLPPGCPFSQVKISRRLVAPDHPEGYALAITKRGVAIRFQEVAGLRAAFITFGQLVRECGRKLPCLRIRDWPDFARRGVMLDISRGRVPKLETLLDLVEKLADFKINELQLYTEHTFAYRRYKRIWQSWGALTAKEIRMLAARCRELGMDLVPNQNSFGHLRAFLTDPKLKKLGEISQPFLADTKDFLRRPTTLAPNHPGTLPFLRGLYDELLPNFFSNYFNIGGDETWDLGKGRSKKLCERKGKGRVYLDFLKQIHREVSKRDKTMMFWGDIILKYPALIRRLPKNIIALNWGYEANHPFAQEAARFARAKISFYVCPGTSTWQTLVGKHDNAFANLRAAANVGKKSGALGFLNTDWGDGGHPQPLAVSWPLFAAGASLAWNAKLLDEETLARVLSRDVFDDSTGKIAEAAFKLGYVHRKLGVNAVNETPLGTVIAAPRLKDQELFCRNGLSWFSKIPANKIRATLAEIKKQRRVLSRAKPKSGAAEILALELGLAARMAAQSCQFMLWQQVVAAGKKAEAARLAQRGIRELQKLQKDFNACWPLRNKATAKHSTPFLHWRIEDYRRGDWR
jgi:hexosaminidase